jgi:hypothetical protein
MHYEIHGQGDTAVITYDGTPVAIIRHGSRRPDDTNEPHTIQGIVVRPDFGQPPLDPEPSHHQLSLVAPQRFREALTAESMLRSLHQY